MLGATRVMKFVVAGPVLACRSCMATPVAEAPPPAKDQDAVVKAEAPAAMPATPATPTTPAVTAPDRHEYPMSDPSQCVATDAPCGMYVVDLVAKSAVTVSIVAASDDAAPARWVVRSGAEEVPATVVKDSEPAPSGLLHSTFVSAAQPFMLALKEPGHPLLPAPKALSGVVAVGENLAALGEKFYASGIVGKSGGVLVEIDPKTGATRALKAPGVKIADVAPAGDKLVVAYTRARDQLIGVYDVAAEAFTVEVTLPAEPRDACKKRGSGYAIELLGLVASPDASRARVNFSCYVND